MGRLQYRSFHRTPYACFFIVSLGLFLLVRPCQLLHFSFYLEASPPLDWTREMFLMFCCCRASQDTGQVYRVTSDGVAGVVFNGVCDWLYRGQDHLSSLTQTICYSKLLMTPMTPVSSSPHLLGLQLLVFKRKLFA